MEGRKRSSEGRKKNKRINQGGKKEKKILRFSEPHSQQQNANYTSNNIINNNINNNNNNNNNNNILPSHLMERTLFHHSDNKSQENKSTNYVLYVMRVALRGHENPALDVAINLANHYRLPVVAFHEISKHYPYASDRFHRFILEGACDIANELEKKGVKYICNVAPSQNYIDELVQHAKCVVAEIVPVEPFRKWNLKLMKTCGKDFYHVDASCVIPLPALKNRFDRAFAFRDATKNLVAQNIRKEWVDSTANQKVMANFLSFPQSPSNIDPRKEDLNKLISSCDIDHSVRPVNHTKGGAKAGYMRWNKFVESGSLGRYHQKRNNAALDNGVSRMSPYLNYGFVSPFRIARETFKIGGDGSEKFLDELLVWRELSWHWCFHTPIQNTLQAIPKWARDTLLKHKDDARPKIISREDLSNGRTGNSLWDLAQKSLIYHGELHNNVRMTWGKALLLWTPTPSDALDVAIELNNRFALDGRDPSSYGGILWCFGVFDRPHHPESPIYGTVRTRPIEHHAKRLDLGKYRTKILQKKMFFK